MKYKRKGIEFYSNGIKTRVIGIHDNKSACMFQTSDDRFLEKYWRWANQDDRDEILHTAGSYEPSEWRNLNFEGADLSIIKDAIAAFNYNMQATEIEESIKQDIKIY